MIYISLLNLLKKYLPHIINVIGNNRRLQRIEDYRERFVNLQKYYKPKDNIPFQSIIEWVVSAENSDRKAKAFLQFIDLQAKELLYNLNPKLHNKVKDILIKILTDFDTKVPNHNAAYANFIGELLILNHISSHSNELFEVKDIEFPLENGKFVDLHLVCTQTGKSVLGEIVSIHIKENRLNEPDDMEKFLIERFNQKLELKTTNLQTQENEIIIKSDRIPLVIFPIIQADILLITDFSQIFEGLDSRYINISPCLIINATIDSKGKYEFRLMKVSDAIKSSHMQ